MMHIRYRSKILLHIKEKPSLELMPDPLPQRPLWSVKTELCFILSTIDNDGDPLGTTISAIKDIYSKLPEGVEIVHSCSTGYGEALIKAALTAG